MIIFEAYRNGVLRQVPGCVLDPDLGSLAPLSEDASPFLSIPRKAGSNTSLRSFCGAVLHSCSLFPQILKWLVRQAYHGIELGMVTMRTLPVVLDDAGAECDAKRLIPTRHVRMPRRALTGSVNGGENDCQRWEIWLRRKLDA
jgi:hypothetical protein